MIHREDSGGIAVVRLEHGKAQALDIELVEALAEEVRRLSESSDVHGVVLTGTGTIYSAGVDLFRVLDDGARYVERFLPALVDVFTALFAFPRPMVAAINGHAIAGGCVMACACDYRLMARSLATIGVPELRVGVPFPYVAIEILRCATPNHRLQELLYLGRTYGVDDALRHGLIDEVVDGPSLLPRACQVALQLASGNRARFTITKQQVRKPALDRIARHAATSAPEVLRAWQDPGTLDAIRRYIEGTLGRGGSE